MLANIDGGKGLGVIFLNIDMNTMSWAHTAQAYSTCISHHEMKKGGDHESYDSGMKENAASKLEVPLDVTLCSSVVTVSNNVSACVGLT